MARALLITNPVAARTTDRVLGKIEQIFRTGGWAIDVAVTTGHGDANRIAQEGVAGGVDLVAVFGGDGTTMQAAAAMVGTDVPLGLLPGGTGNLLAFNLGLPANPLHAAQVILGGLPRRIDLGRLENSAGVKYFAVAAGAGIDARVMTETSSEMKRRWGMMAYLAKTLHLLPGVKNQAFRITVDGEVHAVDAAMMLVANCKMMVPPIISLGNHVSPEDGILDVLIVQSNSMVGSARVVWDVLRDAKGTLGQDVSIARLRGKEISVEVVGGVQPVQFDGENGGETPFTITVAPGALQIMQLAR